MIDLFLNLIGIGQVNRQHLREILVEDDAARKPEVGRIVDAILRNIAVRHVIPDPAAIGGPLRIERSDSHQIGNIQPFHDLLRAFDQVAHVLQPLHVDGVVALHINGTGYAAHQIMRVRILSTKDGVNLDHFLLPLQRFQIVRHRHQVRFGRQLIGWMTPVGILENSELSGIHKLLDGVLDIGKVSGRRCWPARRHLLREASRGSRIGFERRHNVHPVQRMQVIKVNHMILDILRQRHDVADDLRVFRNGDADGILYRPHRGQRVHRSTHAADALAECPSVAGIATLQNYFDAPPHGPGGDCVADDIVIIENGFHPQVTFNARYRIHYYAC